ncbi:unnamed protein product [Paramecium sonneborni]|uniref:Uncharacterized protein n=1 Tax=Paramecium sonneborni TaxID=65129 RepID=A0A8S1NZC1_9CILI|nr:unnamed protein product [Paramecium sonneborni]
MRLKYKNYWSYLSEIRKREIQGRLNILQAQDIRQTIVCISVVLYQMATLYEVTCKPKQAIKWYLKVMIKVPNDRNILPKLGLSFARIDNEPQALNLFNKSN